MTDIDALVDQLTLDEKAALTAGEDFWSTVEVARLGVPKVWLTDGPNGARGRTFGADGPTSLCVPCGSALGATWDPRLVEEVGAAVAGEARRRGARVLLAPTVNLPRSPLAGRSFECYAEDPLLAGNLAAAFVRGAQAQGVAATVKHLVGNDAEHERHAISSDIDERALRELYLRPFELAVRDGGALGLMTAYNRLNGRWVTERPELLGDVARDEWGFDGLVMTDWYGFADTRRSPGAGLDLEMPGPARAFGPALAAAVRSGEVDEVLVDAQVRRLLGVFDRLGALDDPVGVEPVDAADERPEDRAVARRAATGATVLLANDGLLPLEPSRLGSLAVVGPNAAHPALMGGGSAALRPHRRQSPLDALRARLGERVTVRHEPGCTNDKHLPVLDGPCTAGPGGGGPGFDVEVHERPDGAGEVVHATHVPTAEVTYMRPPAPGLGETGWSMRARTRLTPPESGTYELGLVQVDRARLRVDGRVVIDGFGDRPARGDAFLGTGSVEMTTTVELTGGRPVDVEVDYDKGDRPGVAAFRVGWRRLGDDDPVARAAEVAATSDAAVVVVGTTGDWESEGHDRTTLDLPGRQDELVRAVVAANPATVVVVNAGSAVTLDAAGEARALLQCWFGGQEMGPALADVLVGDAEPGGRLPITLPVRVEHGPAHGNFPGENGVVRYGEGVLMGYRWFEARHLPTRFPFGHGLSYATFALGSPGLSASAFRVGETLAVEVPVTNTGDRPGSEVVQCYVAPPAPTRLVRPPQELRAFAKVSLEPGETAIARMTLDDRAFAYWDPGQPDHADVRAALAYLPVSAGRRRRAPGWQVDPGTYHLHVGRSSADIAHVVPVELAPAAG